MTNYNKYSSKNKPTAAEIEAETTTVEETEISEEVVVETVKEAETVVEEKVDMKGIVTASLLNFRSAPRTDGKILDTIKNGTYVKIIKEANGGEWYKIEYNNLTGFVMKTYVEKM